MSHVVKIQSGSLHGIESRDVHIEVAVSYGNLPNFMIVGLGDKAVDEARERVKSAIKNAGFRFHPGKIIVNLTPAYTQKQGTQFDLGIALGILASSEDIPHPSGNMLFIGELSLDGKVRPITGALPFVLHAKKKKLAGVVLPKENMPEVSSIRGINLYPIETLSEAIDFVSGKQKLEPFAPIAFEAEIENLSGNDFADIHGQEIAKRALEIAAAGGHNILLSGVPGAGKTMMARAFVSILPPVTEDEAVELTQIYSVVNALEGGLVKRRPFRSPHHTTSAVGLIGGGAKPRPGEISLAHRGVLFMDEFAEFPRHILETLRQPLEDGKVSIARASGSLTYPSRFTLVAAVNPCPCGFKGSKKKACICSQIAIDRYQKRLSGPILDRIDLHVHVTEIEVSKLALRTTEQRETSQSIKDRVMLARAKQTKRFANLGIYTNAELSSKMVKDLCSLEDEAQKILLTAVEKLNLTTRTYFKVIKIAQTIADLDGKNTIDVQHVTEALSYRPQTS